MLCAYTYIRYASRRRFSLVIYRGESVRLMADVRPMSNVGVFVVYTHTAVGPFK